MWKKGLNWKGKAIMLDSGKIGDGSGDERDVNKQTSHRESSNQVEGHVVISNIEVEKLAVDLEKTIMNKKSVEGNEL